MPSAIPTVPVPLTVGATMTTYEFGPLTRSHFVRYAGAGGDFNPIHHDDEFARSAGMPSVFGMGLLHAGVLSQRLAAWVGLGAVRSYQVRFTAQVWPGDVLTFNGRVVSITQPDDEDAVAELELEVVRQTGERALSARATARCAG